MKYITVPAHIVSEISKDVLDHYHLSPRYSADGSEVILKLAHYDQLFPVPMSLKLSNEEAEPVYPFPVYEAPSGELDTLMTSPKWTEEERVCSSTP